MLNQIYCVKNQTYVVRLCKLKKIFVFGFHDVFLTFFQFFLEDQYLSFNNSNNYNEYGIYIYLYT